MWYANDGAGLFEAWQQLLPPTSFGVMMSDAGDLDGDGDLDLVYLYGYSGMYLLKNQAGLSFAPPQLITDTLIDGPVFLEDLDGDGDLDLSWWRTSSVSGIYAAVNDGGGVFSSPNQLVDIPSGAHALDFGDLDMDGDDDLVVAFYNDAILSSFNMGGGLFSGLDTVSILVNEPHDIDLGDLDGDGDLDLVVADHDDHRISWYPNDGAGTFGVALGVDTFYYGDQVFASDLTGDGSVDIVAGYYDHIDFYRNLGIGSFSASDRVDDDVAEPTLVKMLDVDGDGGEDALVATYDDGTWSWYDIAAGSSDGQEHVASYYASTTRGVLGDIDLDTDSDLVIVSPSNGLLAVIRNSGGGGFDPVEYLSGGPPSPTDVELADLNGDGYPDLLLSTDYDPGFVWKANDGTGHFGLFQWVYQISSSAVRVKAADVDNDGDLDVVGGTDVNGVSWSANDGSGTFGTPTLISGEVFGIAGMEVTDLDGDGWVDIALVSANDQKIAWCKSLGGGVFTTQITLDNSINGLSHIASTDIDGDGDQDLIVGSNGDDRLDYLLMDDLGGFGPITLITTGVDAGPFVLADMDDDSDLDIVVPDAAADRVLWLENDLEHLGVEVVDAGADIEVFPVPFAECIEVRIGQALSKVEAILVGAQGNVVASGGCHACSSLTLNTCSLPSGVYSIGISSDGRSLLDRVVSKAR